MINFSLSLTSESAISLTSLWETALPAVIYELAQSGYAFNEDDITEAIGENGFGKQYPLEPGLATLTAARKTEDGGIVQFLLDGDKFGKAGAAGKDPVLWMRLITLGVRLAATHNVVPIISDPDAAADDPSSPVRLLPG